MTCSEALTKIFLFVANFAFLLVGAALLTLGIFYTVHFTDYNDAIPEKFDGIQYVPITAIIVGSIIFIIAFLGCCGAIKENLCMLTSYASVLIIIFLIQVSLGVFGLLQIKNDEDLKDEVRRKITDLFSKYRLNNETREVIDIIQQGLKCCGTNSSKSWIADGVPVPLSCYSNGYLFEQGCAEAMFLYLTNSIRIVAIVALSISVTEIVGATLALCLTNCIRNVKRRGFY